MAEVVRAIIQLQEAQNNIIDWLKKQQHQLDLVDSTFGAYISMTKVSKKLSKYIEDEIEKKKKEENVAESAQKDDNTVSEDA